MLPTNNWLKEYEQVKEDTICPVDLNEYFEQAELVDQQLAVMMIGPCSVPSGKLLAGDPLAYLVSHDASPYFQAVPAGSYQTEIAVVKAADSDDCDRYAAARICFTDQRPVKFYEALVGDEDLSELGAEAYFGFAVDAGLGCICDEMVHQAFCDWVDQWSRAHPHSNLYDDYFAALFADNYNAHPEFQRDGGDWLNWQIPGTKYHMPIFQSGFGDGVYPVYWGYDASGAICQLVVQFIDIALAYGSEEDDNDDD